MAAGQAPRFPEDQRRQRKSSQADSAGDQSSVRAYRRRVAGCKQLCDTRVAQNDAYGVAEIRNRKIRRLAQYFSVTAINEDRATTCGARAIDVTPAVANNPTLFWIDIKVSCCSQDQAWPRLAAIAELPVPLAAMITNLNAIKRWKRRLQF